MVTGAEVTATLSQLVSCVGCRRSVENLYQVLEKRKVKGGKKGEGEMNGSRRKRKERKMKRKRSREGDRGESEWEAKRLSKTNPQKYETNIQYLIN